MKWKTILTVYAVWWAAVTAGAQTVPLYFGSTNGIVDEFGNLLEGTSATAVEFGHTFVEGDLVQILLANEAILPPATNGTPDAANPLVAVTRIGQGVDPSLGKSGMFGGSLYNLPDRQNPGNTNRIIARVFNAPNLEDASFYADSQPFDVPVFGKSYDVFIAEVTSTTKEMDSSDYDGDGLSRSWEKSYGSNPDDADTDGDGMADGPEIRAGTGVLDDTSLLSMVELRPVFNGDLDVFWDAVDGKAYQLEYTTDDLTDDPEFQSLNPVVYATGLVARTIVTNGLSLEGAHFRVRLVE